MSRSGRVGLPGPQAGLRSKQYHSGMERISKALRSGVLAVYVQLA